MSARQPVKLYEATLKGWGVLWHTIDRAILFDDPPIFSSRAKARDAAKTRIEPVFTPRVVRLAATIEWQA